MVPRSLDQESGDCGPAQARFLAEQVWPVRPDRLRHLLNGLDGSCLHCQKRLSDAGPLDLIWFEDAKREALETYLATNEASDSLPALERTSAVIDGFESPLGMELLATFDWLLQNGTRPTTTSVWEALVRWPGGSAAGRRKLKLFDAGS